MGSMALEAKFISGWLAVHCWGENRLELWEALAAYRSTRNAPVMGMHIVKLSSKWTEVTLCRKIRNKKRQDRGKSWILGGKISEKGNSIYLISSHAGITASI